MGKGRSPRLPLIAAAWIGSAYGMAYYGAPLLPRALAAVLSLHSFLLLVLGASTGIGLGLCAVMLPTWRDDLATRRPHGSHAAVGLVLGPIVVVVSLYLGFELALETLIAEINAGGRRAAQANTGDFGRALLQTHVATTLVWAVVATPIVEELMFRGAVWGAVTNLTQASARAAAPGTESLPPELLTRPAGNIGRFFRSGGIATVLSAVIFTWLHADQQGGAGIVRAVQAGCLGLALGLVRHGSGSIWPGVLLHAEFNLFAIAKARKWFVSPGWPPPLPIPTLYWKIAAICAVILVIWLIHRWPRAREVTARATIFIGHPRGAVYDFVIDPASIAMSFHGHGPIPGAKHAELTSDGGMRVGAKRRVHNKDGSVIDERILVVERPSHHAYELTAGLVPPFSLLVRGGRGDWRLEDEGDGTFITWTFRWNLTTGLAWPVAQLIRKQFAQAMRTCLESHRSHLES